jgi:putative membrane protein
MPRRRQSGWCTGPRTSVRAVTWIVKFALRVVVLAVIIYAVTRLVQGISVDTAGGRYGEAGTYLWVALLFAVVNAIVGPVVRLLSLPFVVLTLGLFLLVVNAALLGLTAALSDRFSVDGLGAAVLGGLLIAVFSWIAELLLPLKVRSS